MYQDKEWQYAKKIEVDWEFLEETALESKKSWRIDQARIRGFVLDLGFKEIGENMYEKWFDFGIDKKMLKVIIGRGFSEIQKGYIKMTTVTNFQDFLEEFHKVVCVVRKEVEAMMKFWDMKLR